MWILITVIFHNYLNELVHVQYQSCTVSIRIIGNNTTAVSIYYNYTLSRDLVLSFCFGGMAGGLESAVVKCYNYLQAKQIAILPECSLVVEVCCLKMWLATESSPIFINAVAKYFHVWFSLGPDSNQ